MTNTERVETFFVTHIGQVSVNDRGAVVFEANGNNRVIVHADTIAEIARGVKKAVSNLKRFSLRGISLLARAGDEQMLNTQEHVDLIAQFERDHKYGRFAKERRDLWAKGYIYENAEINQKFLAYRLGYAYAKALFRQEPDRCDTCGEVPNGLQIAIADDNGSRCYCSPECEIAYNRRGAGSSPVATESLLKIAGSSPARGDDGRPAVCTCGHWLPGHFSDQFGAQCATPGCGCKTFVERPVGSSGQEET